MNLVFDPPSTKSNEYSNLIANYLVRQGHTVYSFDEIFRSAKKFFSVKIVHLNWFEVIGSYYGFIKKLVRLFLLLIFNKKIVWTMHNRSPHTKKLLFLQKVLYYLIAKCSCKIIIHSKESQALLITDYNIRKDKIVYIPHPHYIDVYGSVAKNHQISSSKLRLLFFGAVRPYKNIELLINVANKFKDNIEIHIAGNPENNSYKERLVKLTANNSNISLELEFIDNARLISLMSEYDVMILPYDIRSSLNSGSVLLCFSYARTVIVPEIGTVKDIENKNHLMTYSYDSPKEHLNKLVKEVTKAIEYKQRNSEVFNDWGKLMMDYVQDHHNEEKSQKHFELLYDEILSCC